PDAIGRGRSFFNRSAVPLQARLDYTGAVMPTLTADDETTEANDGLYSMASLAQILDVPAERVCTWITAGLLRPNRRDEGGCYFNFREVSRAKTLADLTATGLSVPSISHSIEQLRKVLPAEQDPLQ